MKVLIRKSVVGSEYWDTESKRTLFVPKGTEPNFEVTKNPKSMITPEVDKKIISVDHSSGTDQNVAAVIKPEEGEVVVESIDLTKSTEQVESNADLEDMTVKELRAYAVKNAVEIPAAIRSKGDILQIIQESEK